MLYICIMLKSFEAVNKTSENSNGGEVPNITRVVMNEAIEKHDAGIVCMSDINSFVNSIEQ